jgi:type II secretory pathway pseudopilin PulG
MRRDQDGFALIGLVVAIFLVLLVLAVAAPRVAQDLRREREVEAVHRANQYVRAIRLFYLKSGGRYPGSVEQLEKTNNVRFLRQKYVDPMTGQSDWRLIHVGEAKTTVKGFFGQPLAGLATTGLGSAAGIASPGATGAGATGASTPGSTSASSIFGGLSSSPTSSSPTSSSPTSSPTSSSPTSPTSSTSSFPTSSSTSSTTSSSSSSGVSSQSATDFKGGGAPFIGIGSAAGGNSILELNEQTTYQTWEFIYDPRIEQLKARASLFGGGQISGNASGLGSAAGSVSPGQGGSTTPTSTTPTPTTPTTTPQ